MNLLLAIVVIVAIALFITGSMASSLQFLIWVAVVLAVIAVIAFLARTITGRRV